VVCQEASIAERFQGQLRGTPILQKVSTFVVLQSQSQTGTLAQETKSLNDQHHAT
jgi:hypothetical protein